ncbi:MAG: GAF domain-containing protein [Anaeromyxobacter sp.]
MTRPWEPGAEVVCGDASHQAALRALEAAVRDTTRLNRLFAILTARGPFDAVLDEALSTLSEVFAADVVALLEQRPVSALAVLAAIGIPEDELGVPLSGGPWSRAAAVLRRGGPVAVEDASSDPGVDPHLRALGLRAAIWLPVPCHEGEPLVLLAARCGPVPFAPADLDLLGAMAYRIGQLVERDRTDRRLREAQERVLQAEKLALAGRLAGSLAHEVSNPLATLLANASALEEPVAALVRAARAAWDAGLAPREAGPEEEVAAILADLAEGTRRIGGLVGAFRSLAAPDRRIAPEAVELSALLAACLAGLPAEPGVPPVRLVPGERCEAFAAPAPLEAGVLGLLRFLAGPGRRRERGGEITAAARHHGGQPAIVITDAGLAVSDEERRRLFDPGLAEVDGPEGRRIQLSLAAAFACQLLRHAGADPVVTAGPEGRGLLVRILVPPVPAGT